MSRLFSNNAKTRLAADITAENGITFSVTTGEGSLFPTIALSSTDFFVITLEDTVGNKEIVKVTSRSGDTLTVASTLGRGLEGTTARAFSAGSLVELRLTSEFIDHIKKGSFTFVIDGGGTTITTGIKGFIEAPFDGTVKGVKLFADQEGSTSVDIYKDTWDNYNPNINPDESICALSTNLPTITVNNKAVADLTGWIVEFEEGDIFYFEVVSCTDITKLTISMSVERY